MDKYFKTLEVNKIIASIKNFANLSEVKSSLDSLELMDDLDLINQALSETDEAVILLSRLGRFPLNFKSDIRKILGLIDKGHIIVLEELVEIYKFLDTIKAIMLYKDSLINLKIDAPHFINYVDELVYPKNLNLRIKDTITPYGEVNDNASNELYKIRRSIVNHEKNIQTKLQEILNKYSSKLTDKLISIRNNRYVIPVKNEYKNTIKGIVHDQSASGETVYIEPFTINELNNKLDELKNDEVKEINKILREITGEIAAILDSLLASLDIIVHFDFVFSKAEYARVIDAKRPKINNEGILELYKCRHPLLNVDNIVPNNIIVGENYNGIIITGPNTGGKTVLLKSIGLMVLMTKLGFLIPCSEDSNVMIFDQVFADIGDEQSIDQNLSTFSSHLKNVINIINNVTNKSLVVLDELGSGTDPLEGSSLAIAIIDYLIKKDCVIIVSSHYSDLKTYAFSSEKIINASVEFDIKTLQPTYKLLIGVPGLSNALDISKNLGLKEEIIDFAKSYVSKSDDEAANILKKLIDQTHEFDKRLNILDDKEKLINNQILENKKLKQQIDESKNIIITKAEKEAQELVSKSSKKINDLIKELEELKSKSLKGHEIADVKHQVKQLKESVYIDSEPADVEFEFKINQSVYIENYKTYGIIIKVNKKDRYEVQIGNASVVVDKKYLKPVEKVQQNYARKGKTEVKVKKDVSSSLDLRGERYEEAKIKLEKFIDEAILGSLSTVTIIHGFGTGIIRELVIDFLKSNNYVSNYRFGGAGEGGQGATIVTLKE